MPRRSEPKAPPLPQDIIDQTQRYLNSFRIVAYNPRKQRREEVSLFDLLEGDLIHIIDSFLNELPNAGLSRLDRAEKRSLSHIKFWFYKHRRILQPYLEIFEFEVEFPERVTRKHRA